MDDLRKRNSSGDDGVKKLPNIKKIAIQRKILFHLLYKKSHYDESMNEIRMHECVTPHRSSKMANEQKSGSLEFQTFDLAK